MTMGIVVPFRSLDLEDAAYEADVRELCRLAHMPGEADRFIRRRMTREEVVSDCILAVFGKRLPQEAAWRFARLCGPAGPARRSRPIQPAPHGIRRRPTKDIPA